MLFWDVTQRALIVTDVLTSEDGTVRLSRNAGDYQSEQRNVPKERKSHLHRGGSVKSRSILYVSTEAYCFKPIVHVLTYKPLARRPSQTHSYKRYLKLYSVCRCA